MSAARPKGRFQKVVSGVRRFAVSSPSVDGSQQVDCDKDPNACDWVCDDKAQCEVKPVTGGRRKRDRLVVRFDDEWVDLTGWRKAHPAGSHWIDLYHNNDATEVMHAFHSDNAKGMLARLPKARAEDIPQGDDAPGEVTPLTRNFRKLREKLTADGWFKRNPLMEAGTLLGWVATMTLAAVMARHNALLSILLLAVSNTSSGWIAHDYVHGRGRWCSLMRCFGQLGAGLSVTWWSDKHNLHHAVTNVVGVDEDVMVDPALYLWAPDPKNDSPLRKIQHLYFMLPYSLLFMIWRIDSIRVALKRRLWGEVGTLGLHYLGLGLLFPAKIIAPAIFLSGALTALIVTVSHVNDELHFNGPHKKDYVTTQFASTRDFVCSNPLFEYVAGGMNYQLEHHLFPTMPRYKYPALVPVLKQFAKDNGVEYLVDSDVGIVKRTINTLRRVSKAPAVEGAAPSRMENPIVVTSTEREREKIIPLRA